MARWTDWSFRRRPTRFAVHAVLAAAIALSGCAGAPDTMLVANAVQAPDAREHKILVATTRVRDPKPGAFYNGERSQTLDFSAFDVSVPPSHVNGHVEWPKQAPGDPRTDFVMRDGRYLSGEKEFIADLNRQLGMRPKGQRKVLFFIHGYNTQFAEGLYRFAQVVDDAKSTAVPVHFSWASRGALSEYVYDNNSATSARDRLEHVFRLVAASDADQINILAHSMGNWVTVEAIRNIQIKGDAPAAGKIGAIVLAAPDIDIDVFKSQMRRIGKPKKPYLVVISQDDRALAASRFLAGGKNRLGDDPNEPELTSLGAIVVDLTAMEGMNAMNHDKFAEIAKIAPELDGVLNKGIGSPGGGEGAVGAIGAAVPAVLAVPASIVSAPIRIIAGR